MTQRNAPQNGRGGKPPTHVRCVLLSGQGRNNPAALIAGLTARGADVHVIGDTPGAMAQIARGARVLIVNEPRTVRRLPELLAAIRRHYPVVQLWVFETPVNGNGHAHPPVLRRINGDEPHDTPPPAPQGKANGHGPRVSSNPRTPAVSLNVSPPVVDPPTVPASPSAPLAAKPASSPTPRVRPADIRRESVTAEELAMLLDPLPSDPKPDEA